MDGKTACAYGSCTGGTNGSRSLRLSSCRLLRQRVERGFCCRRPVDPVACILERPADRFYASPMPKYTWAPIVRDLALRRVFRRGGGRRHDPQEASAAFMNACALSVTRVSIEVQSGQRRRAQSGRCRKTHTHAARHNLAITHTAAAPQVFAILRLRGRLVAASSDTLRWKKSCRASEPFLSSSAQSLEAESRRYGSPRSHQLVHPNEQRSGLRRT